jgi:hypothetical protein
MSVQVEQGEMMELRGFDDSPEKEMTPKLDETPTLGGGGGGKKEAKNEEGGYIGNFFSVFHLYNNMSKPFTTVGSDIFYGQASGPSHPKFLQSDH